MTFAVTPGKVDSGPLGNWDVPVTGWFSLDPALSWSVRAYELNFTAKHDKTKSTITCKVRYGPDSSEHPQVMGYEHRYLDDNVLGAIEEVGLTELRVDKLPEELFLLNSFGFDQSKPAAGRLTRPRLWAGASAAACLGGALTLRAMARWVKRPPG